MPTQLITQHIGDSQWFSRGSLSFITKEAIAQHRRETDNWNACSALPNIGDLQQ
jgi:hypothetical protein